MKQVTSSERPGLSMHQRQQPVGAPRAQEQAALPVLRRCDVESVVERYGHAWRTQNADSLADLFSPQVVYKEKPTRVMEGLSQVEEYWRTQVGKGESNISFTAFPDKTVLDVEKSEAVVVWEAKFLSRKKGRKDLPKHFVQTARLRFEYVPEQSTWRIALLEEYLHHFTAVMTTSDGKSKIYLKDEGMRKAREQWLSLSERPVSSCLLHPSTAGHSSFRRTSTSVSGAIGRDGDDSAHHETKTNHDDTPSDSTGRDKKKNNRGEKLQLHIPLSDWKCKRNSMRPRDGAVERPPVDEDDTPPAPAKRAKMAAHWSSQGEYDSRERKSPSARPPGRLVPLSVPAPRSVLPTASLVPLPRTCTPVSSLSRSTLKMQFLTEAEERKNANPFSAEEEETEEEEHHDEQQKSEATRSTGELARLRLTSQEMENGQDLLQAGKAPPQPATSLHQLNNPFYSATDVLVVQS